jgi:hypothetical protein
MINIERRCEYKKCNAVIEGRKDKKYCCRKHKDAVRKQRKRLKIKNKMEKAERIYAKVIKPIENLVVGQKIEIQYLSEDIYNHLGFNEKYNEWLDDILENDADKEAESYWEVVKATRDCFEIIKEEYIFE